MTALHHIHVKAPDPSRSAAWWTEVLGATPLPSFEIGPDLYVPVELGGVRVNLSRPGGLDAAATRPAPSAPHYGLEHLGITVSDLPRILAALERDGHPVHLRRSTADFEVAFISSPEGVLLELLQPKA